MLAARTRTALTAARSVRAAAPATTSTTTTSRVAQLSSSSSAPSSLLLQSQRRVEAQQQRASDELGDIMAKRWLGNAVAHSTDADRVRPRPL